MASSQLVATPGGPDNRIKHGGHDVNSGAAEDLFDDVAAVAGIPNNPGNQHVCMESQPDDSLHSVICMLL